MPALNWPCVCCVLAGIRIDAEQFSRSRMSYYTGLSIVPSDTLVPAPPEAMMEVTGYPAGAWLNYVTWSPDGTYIAFTTRSPGGPGASLLACCKGGAGLGYVAAEMGQL